MHAVDIAALGSVIVVVDNIVVVVGNVVGNVAVGGGGGKAVVVAFGSFGLASFGTDLRVILNKNHEPFH